MASEAARLRAYGCAAIAQEMEFCAGMAALIGMDWSAEVCWDLAASRRRMAEELYGETEEGGD